MKKTWVKIAFSVLLFVLVLEVGLRILGVHDTYTERTIGRFGTEYGIVSEKHYLGWAPFTIKYRQPEFSYDFEANPDGYREIPFPTGPVDSVDVVYLLGDSFVEGDGAPYDSTMPRFVEKCFHREGYTRVKVYNAGVCGNDPLFAYRFFKERLLHTRPRLVLFFTGPSDMYDLHTRGGFERFTPDGGYRFKPKPPGLDLYRYSRISRLFFAWAGYANGLVPPITPADSATCLAQLGYSLYKSDSLCRYYGIPVLTVGYPHPSEHRSRSYDEYTRRLGTYMAGTYPQVPYMDITADLKDSLDTYGERLYWPINWHFNSRGYGLMGRTVYKKMAAGHPQAFRLLRKEPAPR